MGPSEKKNEAGSSTLANVSTSFSSALQTCPYGYGQNKRSYAQPEFTQLLPYREDARTPLTREGGIKQLSVKHLGDMLETFVDLQLLMQVVETPGATIHTGEPAEIEPEHLPPSYIFDVFGNFRSTPSFSVRDKRVDWQNVYPQQNRNDNPANKTDGHARKFYDVAELANVEHTALRRAGNEVGQLFLSVDLPPDVREATDALEGLINAYQERIIKPYGHYTRIPDNDDTRNYFGSLDKAFDSVLEKFDAMPSFMLKVAVRGEDGKPLKDGKKTITQSFSIPNQGLIRDNLPFSKPLNALFALYFAGRKGTDYDVFPKTEHDWFTGAIGVESAITNSIDPLTHYLQKHTVPEGEDKSQLHFQGLEGSLILPALDNPDTIHNLKLFYHFHKVLNQAYPTAFADIENRLRLAGETPAPATVNTPKEAAVLLYATAKRLDPEAVSVTPDKEQPLNGITPTLRGPKQIAAGLLSLADNVADIKTLQEAGQKLALSGALLAEANRCGRSIAEERCEDSASQPNAGLSIIMNMLREQGLGCPHHARH